MLQFHLNEGQINCTFCNTPVIIYKVLRSYCASSLIYVEEIEEQILVGNVLVLVDTTKAEPIQTLMLEFGCR